MTEAIMTQTRATITVGIDTHADTHVAAALDERGALLGHLVFPSSATGTTQLKAWCQSMGAVGSFGIEGTGSYGASLARALIREGRTVIEIQRPNRQVRRQRGKSDPIDAESAARAVFAGNATCTPKSGDSQVEMIRSLRIARRSAMTAKTQTINQIKALLVTAPEDLRENLRNLSTTKLIAVAIAMRAGEIETPRAAAKFALRSLGRRYLALEQEIAELDKPLQKLTADRAPGLTAMTGVGADVAGALLVAAGDNPDRLRSEGAFAALCGVAPLPASSGKTRRHRLNRGGDRQANSALWRVVMTRLRWDERTKKYAERRTQEGLSRKEIVRCLKRYVAREVYGQLMAEAA
jgi:transposase